MFLSVRGLVIGLVGVVATARSKSLSFGDSHRVSLRLPLLSTFPCAAAHLLDRQRILPGRDFSQLQTGRSIYGSRILMFPIRRLARKRRGSEISATKAR